MVSNLNLLESRRRILLTTPHLESPTPANLLTFKSNMTTKLKEGKVYFTPVQEGTGDPSPDNVRPILGWDGITVTKCGKNLLPDISYTNFWMTGWLNTSGGISPSNNPYITSDFMRVKSGDNYILQLYDDYDGVISNNAWKCIGFYDKNKSFLTGQYYEKGGRNALTVFVPANANYMRVSFTNQNRKSFPDSHFQLEFGTEVTSYEPYQPPTEITIPFPQTIYGGYVDLVNGEVVEEYTAVTLDGENVKVNRGGYSTTNFYGAGWVYATPSGLSTKSGKIYVCDRLPTGDSSTVLHLEASWTGSLYYRIRVIPKSDYPDELTDKEVIDLTNDWLKTNPVTVAYPLATPIHHTIDPQVIKPLKGINTIYSDANGNIEIKFWKH